MSDFIKCPRCELNYIHKDQQYCDVCKAELGMGPELVFAVDSVKEEHTRLCPICKQERIGEDEEMCEKCRENLDFKDDQIDYDNDETWKDYLSDEDDAETETEGLDKDEQISLTKLAEEETAEEEEEDEFEEDEVLPEEDFEYVDPDDPDLLLDEDDEDEEDEEEDLSDEEK